jgi:hypothetical protein
MRLIVNSVLTGNQARDRTAQSGFVTGAPRYFG